MKKFTQALAVACLACWPLTAAQSYLSVQSFSQQAVLLELAWAPAQIFLNLLLAAYAVDLLTKRTQPMPWPWHLAPRAFAIELSLTAQLALRCLLGLLPLAALAAFLSASDKLGWAKPIFWLAGLLGLAGIAVFVTRRLCAPLVLLYQGLAVRDCLEESKRLGQGHFASVLLPLGLGSLLLAALSELGAELGPLKWASGPLAALASAWVLAWAYLRLAQPAKST